MKPRLRLKGGVWSCVSWMKGVFGFTCCIAGYGYTPDGAYRDWKGRL